MGDPAGISAEITLAAWRALREVEDGPCFYAIDDPERLRTLGSNGVEPKIAEIDAAEAAPVHFREALPVLPLGLPGEAPRPGLPNAEHAQAVLESIERAVADAAAGRASGVVTNPINKAALYAGAAFAYPGHTEFLAALGGVARSVMMLASPMLRVVPVTIHKSLKAAIAELSGPLIEETARITHHALRRDFGVAAPRIAVAGLNPHAGEDGAMGREEIEIIAPALQRLRTEGLDIRGPLPADTMFHARARERYDVAICMYHDQALIPLKALDFDRGVNVTLGLPFLRTSPDHGVAYDIAGKGVASAKSLIAAITLAHQLAQTRLSGTAL